MKNFIIAAVITISANAFLIGCGGGEVTSSDKPPETTYLVNMENLVTISVPLRNRRDKIFVFDQDGKRVALYIGLDKAAMGVLGDVE